MKEKIKKIIKAIIYYALTIIILHFSHLVLHINIMSYIKDMILLNVLVSYLLIRWFFIPKGLTKRETFLPFSGAIILLGLTINWQFIALNELFLILCKNKEQKQQKIMDNNIKEYFKNNNINK